MGQFDMTWERVKIEVERLRISGSDSTYDPRLEVAVQYAEKDNPSMAKSEAERITQANPAAGYLAWEAIKKVYLEKGWTGQAGIAADGAVNALKQLNDS
jgi:hypothetical protein